MEVTMTTETSRLKKILIIKNGTQCKIQLKRSQMMKQNRILMLQMKNKNKMRCRSPSMRLSDQKMKWNTKEVMKMLKVILTKILTLFSSLLKTKKANQLLQKKKSKLSLKTREGIKTKIKASQNQKPIRKFKKNGSGPKLEKIWQKLSEKIKV